MSEGRKWTALGMKKLLADKGDDIDDTLEEWADALADKSNTWERMATWAIICVAVGFALGWWFFRGTGCPDAQPAPPVAVSQPTPPLAATAPIPGATVTGKEIKVHIEGDRVVCEAHPPHGGR